MVVVLVDIEVEMKNYFVQVPSIDEVEILDDYYNH